jgi:hypothetical protein
VTRLGGLVLLAGGIATALVLPQVVDTVLTVSRRESTDPAPGDPGRGAK